jgi:hypothetical protein
MWKLSRPLLIQIPYPRIYVNINGKLRFFFQENNWYEEY